MENTKINIPIYRAKKIDSGDEVIGNMGQYGDGTCYITPQMSTIRMFPFVEDKSICLNIEQIDLSTLEISFDNGETWLELMCVQRAINYYSAIKN